MRFWLTVLCPRKVPSGYCKVYHKSRLGTRQQLWDCDEKWSICCIAQPCSHLCPQGLLCRHCDLLLFLMMLVWKKDSFFFRPPDTQSMWSLLPSLLHCTLFFPVAAGILSKGDQQIHSPRDPTPEMKKHQTVLAGLSLPNRLCWLLIENIELGNLHFLVLNLPHIILGYCSYLCKAGLRSPFYYKGFKS